MILTIKMEEFYLIDDYLSKGKSGIDSELSDWPEIDLFSHWHRKIPYSQLSTLLERAWNKAPYDTLKLLFYLRNCHGKGKGERRQFYQGVRWFMEHHPEQILANFRLLPEFGYWKDLLNLWDLHSETLRAYIVYAFCKQLERDLVALDNGEQPSLAAKWAPTEKGADDRKWGFVNLFCEQLGWSRKVYRKNLSKLRDVLGVTERLASDQRWGELDFPDIPVKCRLSLHETLERYCGRRYHRWMLSQPSSQPNKAMYDIAAELKSGQAADSEWNELAKNYENRYPETLCVCDTSPSMDSSLTQAPVNVALALTLLISSHTTEAFRNKVVGFSENPEIVDITGDTPSEKIRSLSQLRWGYSLDLSALLLSLAESGKVPREVFIFTDQNCNSIQFPYRLEQSWDDIQNVYKEKGLVPPEHIFYWNLSGRWGSCSFNLDHYDKGIIVINGFTNEMFNAVTTTGQLYPWIIFKKLLSDPVYSQVKLV